MFPYKKATIDCGFAFVNNIKSLDLNFIAGGGVSGPWGPKDYIYSIACEV